MFNGRRLDGRGFARCRALCAVSSLLVALAAPAARAQIEEEWTVFTHNNQSITCDLVNGSNAEFVVLFPSGELTTVSGIVLSDILVNLNSTNAFPVTYLGEPAGFIAFRNDGDGLPTLFWLSLGETVIGINTLSSAPFDSGDPPSDFVNTLCDACEVVDSSLCDDGTDPPDDFPPIFLCGSGAGEGLVAASVLLPVLGLVRRRR